MDTNTTDSQSIETPEQESVTQDFWCEPVHLAQPAEDKAKDEPSFSCNCGSTCANCGSTCAQCGSTCANCGSTCAG